VPSPTELRRLVFDTGERGYHLLLGLRRHRDWAVLRPRAVDATVANLLAGYRRIVVDLEADLEGHDEVGAIEVEERNLLARCAIAHADVVVAVGTPDLKGLHGLLRVLAELVGHGVEPDRIVPLCNKAGRPGRQRSETTAALAELTAPVSTDLRAPVYVPLRRRLESMIRDGVRLPEQLVTPVCAAVLAALDQTAPRADLTPRESVAVVPGTLGFYPDDEEDR